MFWLLDSDPPDQGMVVDAVDLPDGLQAMGAGSGCASTATDAVMVAAVSVTELGEVTGVGAAWALDPDGPHLPPIADLTTVTCPP